MSEETIILEGKSYDKLVEQAAEKLNVKKEDLYIEIIEQKKSLFSSYFKIKASLEDSRKIDIVAKNIDSIINNQKFEFLEKKIEFKYKLDGVYIEFNKNVSVEEIVLRIGIKKIQNPEIAKIKQAYEAGQFGTEIKFAEPQKESFADSACEVKLAKDLMQAFVYITPPMGGADIKEEVIYDSLKEHKITFGLNDEEIKRIVREKIYNEDVLIAQGKMPNNGIDAVIEYKFDTSTDKKFLMDDEGRVDYRELQLIKNVQKGQLLAVLTPNTPGESGKNVLGADVPSKDGKKLTIPRGKNVEVSADGLQIIAAIDGQVKILDGKVSVFSVYEVKANVDNSTGNIRFIGKVIVNGNVLTGFEIEADGDVEVYGVVEGAKIVSNGNIILHRGINGMGKGELYCEGDLIAKFIENSKIEAKGNIQSDAIMHSQVVCGKKLEVTGKKGLLVGGSFKVGEEIKAKVVGSPMATITEVEVGVSPDQRRRYEVLRTEAKQVGDNLEKTNQAAELLTKLNSKTELPQDKKVLLARSIQLKLQLQTRLEELKNEMAELEHYFEDITRGKIKVSGIAYPGSRITIGSSLMYIKDPVKYATFYRANSEIKIAPYED